jgi:hypothetical protein
MECAKAAQCTRCQHQGRHHAQTAQRATTLVRINVSCATLVLLLHLDPLHVLLAALQHTVTLRHQESAQSVPQAKFLTLSDLPALLAVSDTMKSMLFANFAHLDLRRCHLDVHPAIPAVLASILIPRSLTASARLALLAKLPMVLPLGAQLVLQELTSSTTLALIVSQGRLPRSAPRLADLAQRTRIPIAQLLSSVPLVLRVQS